MPVPDTHSNLRLGLAHPLTVEYGVRFGHGISQNHCLVEYRDNPLVAGQQFAIQTNLMEVSCADSIYQIFDRLTKYNVDYLEVCLTNFQKDKPLCLSNVTRKPS